MQARYSEHPKDVGFVDVLPTTTGKMRRLQQQGCNRHLMAGKP